MFCAGSKLSWSITYETRQILEHQLNTHGDIIYDTPRERKRAKAESSSDPKPPRASVTVATASRTSAPPPVIPSTGHANGNGNGIDDLQEADESAKDTVTPRFTIPSASTILPGQIPVTPRSESVRNDAQSSAESTSGLKTELTEFVAWVPVSDIMPDPYQPREYFSQATLLAMADSMKAEAQVVLVIVRPIPHGDHGKKYMLIDGERRWRAVQYAGFKELLVLVRPNVDARKAFRQSVIANFNREEHTVRENLNVIKRLLADGCTVAEVWTICGKSPAWYYMHMALDRLHADLLLLIDPPTEKRDRLSLTLARKIAYLPIGEQKEAFRAIMREPSVRARAEIADVLARPHMAVSPRNKPSDHMRSVERFALALKGANARVLKHTDVAASAIVANRKPEQVNALLEIIKLSILNLGALQTAVENARKECTH